MHLSEKVTFRGHKGVFAIVFCLEGLIGHKNSHIDMVILRCKRDVDGNDDIPVSLLPQILSTDASSVHLPSR